MSKRTTLIAKIAAIVALLALVASSFAPAFVGAQSARSLEERIQALRAQLAALQAQLNKTERICAAWQNDLRIGSSGPEVTRLQNFLMEKGYAIGAGATGYFGGQTQAALARYQASLGITPAAGYFGTITRSRLSILCDDTVEEERDQDRDTDEEEDEDEDRDDDRGRDRDRNNDDDDDDEVRTSARTTTVDGADNDYATFQVEFTLDAFNQDAYIDRDAGTSFEYEIRDSGGNVVASATHESAVISSSASTEGDYYVINEGDEEEFTLTVTFNPEAADESDSFQLQLLEINYSDEAEAPTQTWRARPARDFLTGYAYIAD